MKETCRLFIFAIMFVGLIEFAPKGFALQASLSPDGKTPQSAPTSKASGGSAPSVASQGGISFEDLIDRSGIKFQLNNSISPQRYSIETMLGGVAVFDYNNDGLLDILFTNGAAIPSLKKTDPRYWNRLYRNNGDGTFTDVTEQAGVKGIGYSMVDAPLDAVEPAMTTAPVGLPVRKVGVVA